MAAHFEFVICDVLQIHFTAHPHTMFFLRLFQKVAQLVEESFFIFFSQHVGFYVLRRLLSRHT